jgi:hypothetical protein
LSRPNAARFDPRGILSPAPAPPPVASGADLADEPPQNPYSAREILLAAAARAVLAALRDPLEERRLPGPAIATLRVLETALEPYLFDLPRPRVPPGAK